MPGPIRSLPPPSKRRKVQKDSALDQSIQQLEADLTHAIANNASLNPLADLVDLTTTTKSPQDTSKAIYALYRVFVVVISNDKLGLDGDDAAKVVKAWLWDRLNTYVDYLGSLLKDEERTLRISALQILMSLQKHLSTSYTKSTPSQPQFHISHFRKLVSFLLLCPASKRLRKEQEAYSTIADPDVLHEFHETWFSVHDDVRWFFLRESATLLTTSASQSHPNIATNILSILERLSTFPTEQAELNSWWVPEMGSKPPKPKHMKKSASDPTSSDEEDTSAADADADDDWRKFFDEDSAPTDAKSKTPSARLHKLTIHQSQHSLASHRAVFTRAWLTLLPRLSFSSSDTDTTTSKSLAMRALNVMHRGVMPHLTRPVLVMDWVGASVDFGGTVGLLALNALFVLMKEYNLDYPSFYTRLYAFLNRDVLHLKHRARFFRMTELFLSSTHLPANLLASFIKRLARLTLTAPPAAIVMVIPFTYNILKRHPALMAMIHRTEVEDGNNDPFLPLETNPLNTQAHLSSLWELTSHRSHYHSGVSTLVKIFSEAFTKPNYAMEDFLDHTYGTLFDTEANRKIKKEPALAIEIGKLGCLFPVADAVPADALVEEEDEIRNSGDIVNELWVFS